MADRPPTVKPERVRLWYATIEHLRDGTSYQKLSEKYGVTISKLRTSVSKQESIADLETFRGTDYMTENWKEVVVPPTYQETRGRKCKLTIDEECIVKQGAVQFQHDMTPMTRQCMRELVQHFIRTFMSRERANEIGFKEDKPSLTWVYSFLNRHKELSLKSTRPVENKRVSAVNPEVLASHFVRLETMCKKYSIDDPRRVFNVDECGVSVKEMTEGRGYKAVCTGEHQPISRGVLFKGSFDHITLMPVVSAAGDVYNPVFVVPGKRVPWKKIDGKTILVNNVLPPGTLLYQRDKASVDKEIFLGWVKHFIQETKVIREGGKKILLVMDCFKEHIQYESIKALKDNDIMVCGLPAHTSHELQPRDKTVFNMFKAPLRSGFRSQVAAAPTGKLDIFDTARLLTSAHNKSLSREIIGSGFAKTGVWDMETMSPNKNVVDSMTITSSSKDTQGGTGVSQVNRHVHFDELVSSFRRERRRLLSNGVVEKEGFIDVDSSKGVNLTSDAVLDALRRKEEQRATERQEKANRAEERERNRELRCKEEAAKKQRQADKKRLREEKEEYSHVEQVTKLADGRFGRYILLEGSRRKRRFVRRIKASMSGNTQT